MKNKFLLPLLCIPFIGFGVSCYYNPSLALINFLFITIFSIVFGLILYKNRNISGIIWLIFLEGLALKLLYITYTPYDVRQHDFGSFSEYGSGHFQYIYYIMNNHTLPFFHQEPTLPICHPPLHYILSAIFLSVIPEYENLQYMTLAFGVCCGIFSYLCLKPVIKNEIYLLLAALFCSFFPVFIIYSGSLNNDILCIMLCIISIFCFLHYINTNKLKFMLISAFFLGLSALSKIAIIPMIYIGICIFFIGRVLMRQITLKDALKSFSLFSVICLPMILIWPVYIYFRWNGFSVYGIHFWGHLGTWSETLNLWFSGYNPFLHVQNINYDNDQYYVGAYSLFERLGIIFQPLTKPYILQGGSESGMISEYNIWAALLKSSLFDEFHLFNLGTNSIISKIGFYSSVILLRLNYVLFILFIIAFLKVSIKDPTILFCKSLITVVILGFICWCLRCPVWFAELFRYIAMLFPCLCFIVAKYIQENLSKVTKINKIYNSILGITVFLFSLTVFLVYTCLYFM